MNVSFWKINSNRDASTASSSLEQKHMLSTLKGTWGPVSPLRLLRPVSKPRSLKYVPKSKCCQSLPLFPFPAIVCSPLRLKTWNRKPCAWPVSGRYVCLCRCISTCIYRKVNQHMNDFSKKKQTKSVKSCRLYTKFFLS